MMLISDPSPDAWGIHWFRRDLRVQGNPALDWNRKRHAGRVLGIFCFDAKFLARPDFSPNRFAFFLKTLEALREELASHGGELLVLDRGPEESFRALAEAFTKGTRGKPAAWSWNRDYEPYAIERDARIQRHLDEEYGIPTHNERDHLLIEPHELFKGEERGSYYQVFGAFKKKWLQLYASEEIQARLKPAARVPSRFDLPWKDVLNRKAGAGGALGTFDDALDTYLRRCPASHSLPPAGRAAALSQLQSFARQGLADYAIARDFPSLNGTSHFSIYFKNGSLTVPEALAELELGPALTARHYKFRDELIWREFYYHILAHVPRVESSAFHLKYESIAWENKPAHLKAWKEGRTGFPIVDAGMRQLNESGWMHNRVRMIVASFLTKDLHCDWKHGERYFMEKLLDGDLAPNNGGWQWAASTGCDPQPYFRIFNPTLQSKRFDPKGEYIRRWVPELADLSDAEIHEPYKKDRAVPLAYPRPIVDHGTQSKAAIALYRDQRGG